MFNMILLLLVVVNVETFKLFAPWSVPLDVLCRFHPTCCSWQLLIEHARIWLWPVRCFHVSIVTQRVNYRVNSLHIGRSVCRCLEWLRTDHAPCLCQLVLLHLPSIDMTDTFWHAFLFLYCKQWATKSIFYSSWVLLILWLTIEHQMSISVLVEMTCLQEWLVLGTLKHWLFILDKVRTTESLPVVVLSWIIVLGALWLFSCIVTVICRDCKRLHWGGKHATCRTFLTETVWTLSSHCDLAGLSRVETWSVIITGYKSVFMERQLWVITISVVMLLDILRANL